MNDIESRQSVGIRGAALAKDENPDNNPDNNPDKVSGFKEGARRESSRLNVSPVDILQCFAVIMELQRQLVYA
jgi:hypothetical protein